MSWSSPIASLSAAWKSETARISFSNRLIPCLASRIRLTCCLRSDAFPRVCANPSSWNQWIAWNPSRPNKFKARRKKKLPILGVLGSECWIREWCLATCYVEENSRYQLKPLGLIFLHFPRNQAVWIYTYEGICWCMKSANPEISVMAWKIMESSRDSAVVSISEQSVFVFVSVSELPCPSSMASETFGVGERLLQFWMEVRAGMGSLSYQARFIGPSWAHCVYC